MRQNKAGFRLVSWLVAGFCLAVAVRVIIGGQDVAYSGVAGLVFAAGLVGLSWGYWRRNQISWRILGWGLFGTAVLFVPVAALHFTDMQQHARPAGNYLAWALIVAVVAAAEELFLRGKLYDAVTKWRGRILAIVVGAALFAALHVPLYGWHVVPLDFAVGLWLGALRASSGSWAAPATAHVLADWGAWWIV